MNNLGKISFTNNSKLNPQKSIDNDENDGLKNKIDEQRGKINSNGNIETKSQSIGKNSVNKNPGQDRTLGKFTEIALRIFSKFKPVNEYLVGRREENRRYYQNKLKTPIKYSSQTKQEIIQPDNLSEIITIEESLFLSPEQIKTGGDSYHPFMASLAVQKSYHVNVTNLKVPGLKEEVKPYYYVKNTTQIIQGQVVPTSYLLGNSTEANQLMNIYVLDLGGKKAVIRTGVINTEEKAKAFTALIKEIYKDNGGEQPLRVVSQQLNSFENEEKLINSQHRWIAQVNKDLKGKAEVVHINIPSNRWYHTTKAIGFLKALAPKNFFKGEDLSKEQNMDGLGTYLKWTQEDLFKGPCGDLLKENKNVQKLKSIFENDGEKVSEYQKFKNKEQEKVITIEDNKILIKSNNNKIKVLEDKLKNTSNKNEITNMKSQILELKNNNKKLGSEIKEKTLELKKIRKDFKEMLCDCFKTLEEMKVLLENYIKKNEKEPISLKDVTHALQTLSLSTQMLGSQLGIKGHVLDRGKEGMVIQKLNDRLGVTSALNCKSGLDRTTFWQGGKLAMIGLDKEAIGEDRSFALVNDWETTTTLMNKLSSRLGKKDNLNNWLNGKKTYQEWKTKFGNLISVNEGEFKSLITKMQDVAKLRNYVLLNLVNIGLPITKVSTGLVGLKWNSGYQENLVPLNFLPSHVKVGNKSVPLVKYSKLGSGKISGISIRGRRLLTKFQKMRGS